jgi:hypothetical protein
LTGRERQMRVAIVSLLEILVLPIAAAVLANELTPSGVNGRPLAGIAFTVVAAVVAFGKLHHAPQHEAVKEGTSGSVAELHTALVRLRGEVSDQWTAELANRRLDQPKPVRLRFKPSAKNTATAISITQGLPPTRYEYLNVGTVAGRKWLVHMCSSLPGPQLLILGDRGSGKSTTALLLTTDLLRQNDPAAPVPVLLSLADWDPTQTTVEDWICDKVSSDYGRVANLTVDGRDAVRALLNAHKIIAVLDGLDERSGDSLRDAIVSLSYSLAHGMPAIITCRTNQFVDAAKRVAHTLGDLDAVEIQPIDLDDITVYLEEQGRQAPGWESVILQMKAVPDSALAQALSTPLMLWLAVQVFTHDPGSDQSADRGTPSDLLHIRYSSRQEIEDFLLTRFLRVVYTGTPRLTGAIRHKRYSADEAERYLTFLAKHLIVVRSNSRRHLGGGTDICWWRLCETLPRWERGVAGFLTIGPLVAAPSVILILLVPGLRDAPSRIIIPLMLSLVTGITSASLFRPPLPGRVRLGLGPVGDRWRALKVGLAYGAMAAGTLTVGLAAYLSYTEQFGQAVQRAIATALLAGLAVLVVAILNGPLDTDAAPSPQRVLREDRQVAIATCALTASLFALVIGFESGSLLKAVTVAIGCGLATGLGTSAWGWFAALRAWLFVTGRGPIEYIAFLQDAYLRGVLRKSGTAYQFRHARLRNILLGIEPEK